MESVDTTSYIRKKLSALERAVEVHAVDQGLAERTKAAALVDASEEVALEQQFLQTKTLSWPDVEPELELSTSASACVWNRAALCQTGVVRPSKGGLRC